MLKWNMCYAYEHFQHKHGEREEGGRKGRGRQRERNKEGNSSDMKQRMALPLTIVFSDPRRDKI